ncbi:MAG: hypothetical protein ACOY0T_08405 [Myxococcota bacterium]
MESSTQGATLAATSLWLGAAGSGSHPSMSRNCERDLFAEPDLDTLRDERAFGPSLGVSAPSNWKATCAPAS